VRGLGLKVEELEHKNGVLVHDFDYRVRGLEDIGTSLCHLASSTISSSC